jgi:ArsR family transcriptional regulator
MSSGRVEVAAVVEGLTPVERAVAPRHLAVLEANHIVQRDQDGAAIHYSLREPALKIAVDLMSEHSALCMVLAHPIAIEILEHLSGGAMEQEQLIQRIEPEEKRFVLDDLQSLIDGGFIFRKAGLDGVFYEITEARVREVLRILRRYFEEHLAEALAMITKMSYAHLDEASEHLKQHLQLHSLRAAEPCP